MITLTIYHIDGDYLILWNVDPDLEVAVRFSRPLCKGEMRKVQPFGFFSSLRLRQRGTQTEAAGCQKVQMINSLGASQTAIIEWRAHESSVTRTSANHREKIIVLEYQNRDSIFLYYFFLHHLVPW